MLSSFDAAIIWSNLVILCEEYEVNPPTSKTKSEVFINFKKKGTNTVLAKLIIDSEYNCYQTDRKSVNPNNYKKLDDVGLQAQATITEGELSVLREKIRGVLIKSKERILRPTKVIFGFLNKKFAKEFHSNGVRLDGVELDYEIDEERDEISIIISEQELGIQTKLTIPFQTASDPLTWRHVRTDNEERQTLTHTSSVVWNYLLDFVTHQTIKTTEEHKMENSKLKELKENLINELNEFNRELINMINNSEFTAENVIEIRDMLKKMANSL